MSYGLFCLTKGHPKVSLNDAVELANLANHTNRTKNYDSILRATRVIWHEFNEILNFPHRNKSIKY